MNNNKLHTVKTSGFKTPDNYFNEIEDVICNVAKLSDTIKQPGFTTPDNYFESLESKITTAITKEEEPKVIPLFSWQKVMAVSAVAAVVLLMFNLSSTSTTNSLGFSDIETVSIENYISEEDFTTEDFSALINENELSYSNFTENSLTDASIEEYLIENASIEDLIID